MHLGILFLLSDHGLRNQQIGQAVLEGLTAEPLRRIFAAVLAETCKDGLTDEEVKIINNIIK
jgi:hypothetical protein